MDRLREGVTRFIDLWLPDELQQPLDTFNQTIRRALRGEVGRFWDSWLEPDVGPMGQLISSALRGSLGDLTRLTSRQRPTSGQSGGVKVAGPAFPGDGTVPTGKLAKGQGVLRWSDYINEAADYHDMPAIVIAAIMSGESSGDASARSGAGATGLMQIMPQYHAWRASKYGGDLSDPRVNIMVGAEILKENYTRAKQLYPEITDHRAWEIAAAAYLGDWDWERGTYAGRRDMYGTDGRAYVERFNQNLQALAPYLQGSPTSVSAPTPQLARAIEEAKKYLGMPYVFGGASPQTSFDCSGLVQWSYRQAGINLPRTAQQQWDATERVSDPQPGDLVFFTGTYDAGVPITHVGIYLGNGMMLNAQNNGVVIESIDTPYWRAHFAGFGRIRS